MVEYDVQNDSELFKEDSHDEKWNRMNIQKGCIKCNVHDESDE